MRPAPAILLIAGALLFASCGTSPQSAIRGAQASTLTNIGPIPGDVTASNHRTNPYANDAVALQDGYRLFNWYNCSGCHGGHAGGGMGPSLRDETWMYGSRDDQIFDTIVQGRSNGMPAWGTKIPEDQVWQLVTYIKSMRTPQEPAPPVEPADEMAGGPWADTLAAKGEQAP